MIELDEDALICDLAETYHIYDYRSLPLKLVATLSAGLRDDSRIKMQFAGLNVPTDTFLLAAIADRVDAMRYMFSDTKETPVSFVELLNGKTNGRVSFETAEDFEATLKRIKGES